MLLLLGAPGPGKSFWIILMLKVQSYFIVGKEDSEERSLTRLPSAAADLHDEEGCMRGS